MISEKADIALFDWMGKEDDFRKLNWTFGLIRHKSLPSKAVAGMFWADEQYNRLILNMPVLFAIKEDYVDGKLEKRVRAEEYDPFSADTMFYLNNLQDILFCSTMSMDSEAIYTRAVEAYFLPPEDQTAEESEGVESTGSKDGRSVLDLFG